MEFDTSKVKSVFSKDINQYLGRFGFIGSMYTLKDSVLKDNIEFYGRMTIISSEKEKYFYIGDSNYNPDNVFFYPYDTKKIQDLYDKLKETNLAVSNNQRAISNNKKNINRCIKDLNSLPTIKEFKKVKPLVFDSRIYGLHTLETETDLKELYWLLKKCLQKYNNSQKLNKSVARDYTVATRKILDDLAVCNKYEQKKN